MPVLPTQTFNTLDEWETWIDANIVTNGVQGISGNDGNITENAAVKFIRQSPINWQRAQVINSSGVASASRPVVIFITSTPSSFTFGDNIYNQYCFVNTTSGAIPLGNSQTYYDINLVALTSIPPKSIVNISKAQNSLWIVNTVPSQGSQSTLPPYVGIVDRGQPNDPVSGTSLFQSNVLKNLGASNDNNITINIDGGLQQNYGVNKSFEYDPVAGEIDLDYNSSGNQFFAGSSLTIDLNQ